MLFSGLGADERLFSKLSIPGTSLATPRYPEPTALEDLHRYAERLAALNGISSGDVVGGASFGGMAAAQIAAQSPVAGLVLLGSCPSSLALPAYYPLFELAVRATPDFILGMGPPSALIRWFFGPVSAEDEACLVAMLREASRTTMRRLMRMAVRWPGAPTSRCPSLTIHGGRDRLIPLTSVRADAVLSEAGHAFTLSHPAETSELTRRFINGLDGMR